MYVSGSQDALGLMLPGISRLEFDGAYWPQQIKRAQSSAVVAWLERVLWLVPLPSRPDGYNPLKIKNVTQPVVARLADASQRAWDGVLACDAAALGCALSDTMVCWHEMLPETVPEGSEEWLRPYAGSHGCLFSGAGGGFLLVVSDTEVLNGFHIEIQNEPWTGA